MNIGQASKNSGVSAKMIRYYEQINLIPKAERTESGYRDYSARDIQRLHFIKRARDLGFSLEEIDTLLALWHDKSRQSADVKRIAQTHILRLHERINHLQQMVATLENLVKCCAGNERPECPILSDLEDISDGLKAEQNMPDLRETLRHRL